MKSLLELPAVSFSRGVIVLPPEPPWACRHPHLHNSQFFLLLQLLGKWEVNEVHSLIFVSSGKRRQLCMKRPPLIRLSKGPNFLSSELRNLQINRSISNQCLQRLRRRDRQAPGDFSCNLFEFNLIQQSRKETINYISIFYQEIHQLRHAHSNNSETVFSSPSVSQSLLWFGNSCVNLHFWFWKWY